MISQRIIADVGTNKSDSIHFVQGEQGRVINVHFINSLIDEEVFLDLSGYVVTIHILKPDGNFTIDNMTINGYTASYSLSDRDCIVGGSGIYDISLSKNNELIYTAHGDYIGDMRAIPDSAVNSVSTAYGVTFPEGFQEKLTAGEGIILNNNIISATGTKVDITPLLSSGLRIADYSVDDIKGALYVPTPTRYNVTPLFESATPVFTGFIQLNDDITNYDALMFTYMLYTYGIDGSVDCSIIDAAYFDKHFAYSTDRSTPHFILNGWDNYYCYVQKGNADRTLYISNAGGTLITGVIGVYGITY